MPAVHHPGCESSGLLTTAKERHRMLGSSGDVVQQPAGG